MNKRMIALAAEAFVFSLVVSGDAVPEPIFNVAAFLWFMYLAMLAVGIVYTGVLLDYRPIGIEGQRRDKETFEYAKDYQTDTWMFVAQGILVCGYASVAWFAPAALRTLMFVVGHVALTKARKRYEAAEEYLQKY